MNRLMNLVVSTFTVFVILLTFGMAWMIMGALRVPDVLAFFASLMYSSIPIYIFVRDEIKEREIYEENQDVSMVPSLHIPSACPVSGTPSGKKRRSKQSTRNQGSHVQSGGFDSGGSNGNTS
jgi:uncharacterized membrane protein YgcG